MRIIKIIKRLSQKKISSEFDFSTYLVRLEDEVRGVWKPYPTVHVYSAIIAYEIAKILQFDLMPKTIYCFYGGHGGTLHEWVTGETWVQNYWRNIKINFESMQRLAIFDFLTLNSDRAIKNIVIRANGDCVGIDNETSFCVKDGVSFNISYCMGVTLSGHSIRLIQNISEKKDEILKKLGNFLRDGDIIRVVSMRIRALEAIIGINDSVSGRFGI